MEKHSSQVARPNFRRLYGYSFDPSLSVKLDTALVNETVFKIQWEENLESGPSGEYLEIIDYDPASRYFYEPVDLNNPYILAQDGLRPSEGNPQFHQQMVYAVAMTTIQNFERALGRKAMWSAVRFVEVGNSREKREEFLQKLRVYPHALRQANAYYSPEKKALLFGYFPASGNAPGEQFPGGMVFTCLSHDIVAHETTHALLDGIQRQFIEPSHRDTLAFHEAFADIVALFQHFTFPEVLRHQIAKTRGNLASQNLLGELAQQFGRAIGRYGALREFINAKPDPNEYATVIEPHDRGAILVAAVFEAFLSIYKCRIADILRIATSGSGVLPDGDLHPDLVNRLAREAAKTAQHILNMCIRALDYCPPVDTNFGDYLRAIITADLDLVPDDDLGYRIAFIEAFRRRGIYPRDIRTLSEDSLCWKMEEPVDTEKKKKSKKTETGIFEDLGKSAVLTKFIHELEHCSDRRKIFIKTKNAKGRLNELLKEIIKRKSDSKIREFEEKTGLYLSTELNKNVDGLRRKKPSNAPVFQVEKIQGARRIGPDGDDVSQIIISLVQTRDVPYDESIRMDDVPEKDRKSIPCFKFRGGCNLILNLKDRSLRYAIKKRIDNSDGRLTRQYEYRTGDIGASLRATYFGKPEQEKGNEPFAFLHNNF